MKPKQAATIVTRVIGVLTLGWVYYAVRDLLWLLHMHKMHLLITKAPLEFSYYPYLTCSILNVTLAALVAAVLLVMPACLLRGLMPGSGKRMPWNMGWFTTAVAIGLVLLVYGLNSILATVMWTIFSAGREMGWQIELCAYTAAAATGIFLCRKALAGRQGDW